VRTYVGILDEFLPANAKSTVFYAPLCLMTRETNVKTSDLFVVYFLTVGEHVLQRFRVEKRHGFTRKVPRAVFVETTNLCNRCCKFCYWGYVEKPKLETMEMELYARLLLNIRKYVKRLDVINLYLFNEPLTDPWLRARVLIAKSVFGSFQLVRIFTNTELLQSDRDLERLIDIPRIGTVIFNANIYSKKDLDRFMELRRRLVARRPDLASSIRVEKRYLTNKEYRSQIGMLKKLKDKFGNLMEDYGYTFPPLSPKGTCFRPANTIVVRHDGALSLCCFDFSRRTQYGKILEDSQNLVETWREYTYSSGMRLKKGDKTGLCLECEANDAFFY